MNETRNKATVPIANLEPDSCDAPNGKEKTKGLDSQCNIHMYSRRYRLADPDGLSGKAVIDGFVLCGLLKDDSAKEIKKVSFSQEKIKKPEREETIVTLEWED